MARHLGTRWEFCIKRKGVLPKPVYFSFPTREEGDAFCARIEKLLDAGVIPTELTDKAAILTTISLAYEHYNKSTNPISAADQSYWPIILKRYGTTRITAVDYPWVERMVDRCRDEFNLSPSSIRHHVGALSRLWDWLLKRESVATNPFKSLRVGYASSGDKQDVQRDRRPTEDEIANLSDILTGEMKLMFLLALESAMRMREIYTLSWDQIDLPKRTIYLNKTKNGDTRQVPLSSVAIELLGKAKDGNLIPTLWDGKLTPAALKATTSKLSVAFGRACEKAGCADLRFHDLRHEATCRLFEKTTLDWLEISTITGHRDPRMLKRYANLRGSDLAAKLW